MEIFGVLDPTTGKGLICNLIKAAEKDIENLSTELERLNEFLQIRPQNELDKFLLDYNEKQIKHLEDVIVTLTQLLEDNKENEWFSIPNLY